MDAHARMEPVHDVPGTAAPAEEKPISAKRKLQNRMAQRKYREKMKNRVAGGLKQVTEKKDQSCLDGLPASQSKTARSPIDHDSIESLFPSHLSHQDGCSFDDTFNLELSVPCSSAGDMNKQTSMGQMNFPDVFTPSSEVSRMLSSFNEPSGTAQVEFDFQSYLDQLSLPDQTLDTGSHDSFLDTMDSNFHDVQNATRNTPPKVAPRLPEKGFSPSAIQAYPHAKDRGSLASAIIQQLCLDDTKENLSLVKTSIARGYNIRDVFLTGLSALGKEDLSHRQAPLPNPRMNTLTLVPVSTLQAYMSIAIKVGYNGDDVHKHDLQTPFYKPNASFNALFASYKNIPLHLRPTMPQIMYPHPPWMDILPFPTLRERVKLILSTDPSLVDLLELKDDLFMRNGLICWRSGEKGGSGQAWDYRNWEAEPWFLRKWNVVVGGEGGEVWEQTQWWRSMRGKERVKADEEKLEARPGANQVKRYRETLPNNLSVENNF